MHLAGLARDMGVEVKVALVKDHDFTDVVNAALEFKPDFVGFNIYTGNHLQTFEAIDRLKRYTGVKVIVGGPHPSYFPLTAIKHADYVVMSEGFHSLKTILSGEAKPGIIPFTKSMRFPHPDRQVLYKDYPEYARSPIKSIIGMTGCPYRCTYCYNSSSLSDIQVPPDVVAKMAANMNKSGRLFPFNIRTVEDVLDEAREIEREWGAEIVYFQDDVHGFDTKVWLPELAKQWSEQLDLAYHAQMRWEMVNGDGGKRRLDLIKTAGCTGLTLAIESADATIRKEVLDRATPESLMFDGMDNIKERGLLVRTEQITGLPYGATSTKTPMNLDADLALVELNCRLKPEMAWASTFVPYSGTKLGKYSQDHGHYWHEDNFDVKDSFFDRSVLRFPKEWVGEHLNGSDDDLWLNPMELGLYRDQNKALRDHFNVLCLIPQGHILARQWLNGSDISSEDLNNRIKHHLYDEVLYKP
tara:strand:+ start:481 stop:1890 length:1410 start_codon:yes stop_codon:yes gene_type:complete